MKDNATGLYRDNYKLCQKIVDRVVGYLARASRKSLRDELYSEAWLCTLEFLPLFEPDRGMKLSTFLWGRILWRLRRYIHECEQLSAQSGEEKEIEALSTESAPETMLFEYNPYQSTPDVVYERKENISLWQKLKRMHPDAVDACVSSTHLASSTHRANLSKQRKMALPMLQKALKKLF